MLSVELITHGEDIFWSRFMGIISKQRPFV